MAKSLPNITGKIYGRLTVIRPILSKIRTTWECRCNCGNITIALPGSLKSGRKTSCGCALKEHCKSKLCPNKTHGMSRTKVYSTWRAMLRRCEDKNQHNYNNYGGRGIKVCEEWHDFNVFYVDMKEPPSDYHTIDRKNNDLGYFKDNCKWSSPKEQRANQRRSNVS